LIAEGLNLENVIYNNSKNDDTKNNNIEKNVSQYIGLFSLENNLSILTTGPIPPNPTILLSSPQMQDITAQFKRNFDLIIYDTSSLLEFADTSLLMRYIDASILAIRIGKTNRSVLAKVLEQLNFYSTPILGAVSVAMKG
jgi:Mrp family chromosome partitioning ATPase